MRTKSGRGDVLLVCMVLFLVVFGLAVLYSTGSYNGRDVYKRQDPHKLHISFVRYKHYDHCDAENDDRRT